MTMTRGKLTIKEPLGIFWPRQYVRLQTTLDHPVPLDNLILTDPSGTPVDADFFGLDGNILTVGLMLSLHPHETL